MAVELYPHQQLAVDHMANGKILRGDPGVGKSITALAYFFTKECGGVINDWGSMRTPKDLFILTTAKKRDSNDWQRDAFHMGLMENSEISVSGVKVTVDSWNNIERYLDVKDAFFIFDEAKAIGSGLWAKTFMKIAKNNNWIMLSGTPGDVWMDFVPVFIANGFYKNRSEFKEKHVVYAAWSKFPKIERYVGINELVRNRNAVLVEMVYKRHTTRHLKTIVVGYDAETMERVAKDRWHVYEERPIRDVGELFAVSRKVANSDPSRLREIRALQKKHKRLIVFYNFDYELEILRGLAVEPATDISDSPALSLMRNSTTSDLLKIESPSSTMSPREAALRQLQTRLDSKTRPRFKLDGPESWLRDSEDYDHGADGSTSGSQRFLETSTTNSSSIGDSCLLTTRPSSETAPSMSAFTVAEWNGHKHQPVPTTDEWIYLVQYRAGAEAWNCTSTDAMAFYSLTYSYKDFEQCQGRIDRLNTLYDNLFYYILVSDAWIDLAINKSLDAKQDFNEKRHRIHSDADLGLSEAA